MRENERFEFFPKFSVMEGRDDIKAGHNVLDYLYSDEDVCLGERHVGDKVYNIFYLKDKKFCVYYLGGSEDPVACSKELDSVVHFVNDLH